MIISDLNHVEVVSEETETSIEGGWYYYGTSNYATAFSDALAFGQYSSADTFSITSTGSGVASSTSGSSSSSSNYGYYWW